MHVGLFLIILLVPIAWSQEVCRTPNQRNGKCVPRTQCPSFDAYFSPDRILNENEINYLLRSQCASNPPKICCPDRPVPTTTSTGSTGGTGTTITTTTTTTTARPDLTPLPNATNYECGVDILGFRIFGGTDTDLDEFPWYALLEYVTKKGEREFNCGGSLISSRYVLTAAHCLSNSKLDEGMKLVNIRLGEHNTATEIDCEETEEGRTCADPPQNFGYEELILHEGYSKNDPNQHHDIALIRLDGTARISFYVTPICLPEPEFMPTRTGINVTISGFGHTGRRKHSGIKQKALVPMWDWTRCQGRWSSIKLGKDQLCAGGAFNIDSCGGDSGGPLMTQRLYWTLEAIVSFGNRCGLEDWPGVYTRVSGYIDWIKSKIRH